MASRTTKLSPALCGLLISLAAESFGQGPTLPAGIPRAPGTERPLSLSSPGALTGTGDLSIGGQQELLGGRPGPSVPRVPATATTPGQRTSGVPLREEITTPSSLPLAKVPLFGKLAVPEGREDEGPADGLTLDQAIERVVHDNLALRARAFELPQADADMLTASLRANPLLYADSQLIPYGSYSLRRPGGPLQYDLNITYPLDVTRKRRTHARGATSEEHASSAVSGCRANPD